MASSLRSWLFSNSNNNSNNSNNNNNNAQQGNMMKFKVVVPPNVKSGQVVRIRCPDGTEGDVRVPRGAKPGGSFIFEMPVDALVNGGKGMTTTTTNNNNNSSSNPKSTSISGSGSNHSAHSSSSQQQQKQQDPPVQPQDSSTTSRSSSSSSTQQQDNWFHSVALWPLHLLAGTKPPQQHPASSDSLRNSNSRNKHPHKSLHDSNSNTTSTSTSTSTSFLDREIVDRQDLFTALAVGVLIGLSIVGGFLVGVIIVTEEGYPQEEGEGWS